MRDRGCLFSQDVYALLPNVEGQIRAASIQSSSSRAEEFDDRTFKCVFPLRDGGTSICTLIHKKFKPMETQEEQEEEVQSVCKYINIYRVDAIVLLVKSNRDLDPFSPSPDAKS